MAVPNAETLKYYLAAVYGVLHGKRLDYNSIATGSARAIREEHSRLGNGRSQVSGVPVETAHGSGTSKQPKRHI